MKNRLVRELESYEGYVPEPKECAKGEVVYDMPESEFDTYEVVVREATDYVVVYFAKTWTMRLTSQEMWQSQWSKRRELKNIL